MEVERAGVAAAREDLATTRERLRRSQDEDLARAVEEFRIATSDLEMARETIATLTVARNDLDRRVSEEREARRRAEADAEAVAVAARREAAEAEAARAVAEATVREDAEKAAMAAERAATERLAATEAELRTEANEQEEKLAQQIEEAYSLAAKATAEAEAAKAELEEATKEVEGVRERLVAADVARAATEARVAVVIEERDDLERRLRLAEEQVRGNDSAWNAMLCLGARMGWWVGDVGTGELCLYRGICGSSCLASKKALLQ